MFGTKKVYSKIMNGKLVIRVGGGYMVVDEFIQTYGELEMIKIQAMKGASGDLIQEENSISFSKKKNFYNHPPFSSFESLPYNFLIAAPCPLIRNKYDRLVP